MGVGYFRCVTVTYRIYSTGIGVNFTAGYMRWVIQFGKMELVVKRSRTGFTHL